MEGDPVLLPCAVALRLPVMRVLRVNDAGVRAAQIVIDVYDIGLHILGELRERAGPPVRKLCLDGGKNLLLILPEAADDLLLRHPRIIRREMLPVQDIVVDQLKIRIPERDHDLRLLHISRIDIIALRDLRAQDTGELLL